MQGSRQNGLALVFFAYSGMRRVGGAQHLQVEQQATWNRELKKQLRMAKVDGLLEELNSRFHALYPRVIREKLDRTEFKHDDLYAFQVFERALRSNNQELRSLAAHLQAQRHADIETITLVATPPPQRTGEPPSLREAPAPPRPRARRPASARKRPERRSGEARLSRTQAALVSDFQQLYTREFGTILDIGQFIFDDDYGRAVLYQSLGTNNLGLVKCARNFLDENGRPKMHRRGAA